MPHPRSSKLNCLAALFLTLSASACSFMLPPHKLSHDLEGELVTIKLLDDAQMDHVRTAFHLTTRGEYHYIQFTLPQETTIATKMVVPAAAVAGPLAGLAVDFIKNQLTKEASRYEASFTAQKNDDFWSIEGNKATQKYVGFELRRETTNFNANNPSFEMLVEFTPILGGQMLEARPTYLAIKSAKAKVLARRWWSPSSWLLSLPFISGTTGHQVQVSVDGDVTANWFQIDKDNNRKFSSDKLGPLSVPAPGWAYDLEGLPWADQDCFIPIVPTSVKGNAPGTTPTPTPGPYCLDKAANTQSTTNTPGTPIAIGKLEGQTLGSFPPAPISMSSDRKPSNSGIVVKVTITERDPSNAKNYIERGATTLGEHKQDIVNIFVSATPTSNPTQKSAPPP